MKGFRKTVSGVRMDPPPLGTPGLILNVSITILLSLTEIIVIICELLHNVI